MSEDMIFNTGVDMAVVLTPGDRKVFDMVDTTVDQAVAQGDIQPIMAMGRALKRNIQASGLALAKLLSRVSDVWESMFNYEDDMYEVFYTEMGIAHSTAYKYINMWKAVFENPEIPDEVKQGIEGKPMKSLLLLTAAAREGQLSGEDWERVAEATTSSEVRGIVRDIRGERTSSSTAMMLELSLTTGAISVRKGSQLEVVGMLLVSQRDKNDLIEAAIAKIVSSTNMMEK